MSWSTLAFLIIWLVRLSTCGGVSKDGTCSTKDDHVDPDSHKFMSDCNDQTYCTTATNGTCQTRQCRRDEFPFGYGPGDAVPPLCPRGSFCPDEGSGCQPLRSVGQSCQLSRDDQCAPPPNWQQLASSQNANGSLCLHSTCVSVSAHTGRQLQLSLLALFQIRQRRPWSTVCHR
ncbi:hypothetical protein OBBRIDRAFT_798017 [Obba rivulosa]|uniref:Uncharacterized protein n=1 Tax=Obba rivulosa TaxID=1052685 RepID=A0A8E2DG36_9APHY|nr:hypothetical protein OBBRIDRAFT_798017 [Obba rivulosa]